ncbi:hypothetical protein ACIGW7_39870 [Streptomyces sp. NPDC053253]|uniref:hypothetical protein n=1 Tax=Streptomyces sp. NPDC053253 TaxID=3365699 RepID=UPI0037D95F0C
MPLNILVTLPEGRVTVHSHSKTLPAGELAALGGRDTLESTVREGLRWVSDCHAARSVKSDVDFTEHTDGAVEAVARVLCSNETCTGVAEHSRLVGEDEHTEAEAARRWAAEKLAGTLTLNIPVNPVPSAEPGSFLAEFTAANRDRMARRGRQDLTPESPTITVDEMPAIVRRADALLREDEEKRRAEVIRLLSTPRGPMPGDASHLRAEGALIDGRKGAGKTRLLGTDGQPSLTTWTTDPHPTEES